jgi:hypothetical protein
VCLQLHNRLCMSPLHHIFYPLLPTMHAVTSQTLYISTRHVTALKLCHWLKWEIHVTSFCMVINTAR